MFDNIATGQTVRIHFTGSTQGLAQRVQYDGEQDGDHLFSGLGVLSDARLRVHRERGEWVLSTGRVVTSVEVV